MKFLKQLFLLSAALLLALSASAQRRQSPKKQLSKAPGNDPGYTLISDNNGELDFALLSDYLVDGIDTAYCTSDSCFIVDNAGNIYYTGAASGGKVFRFSSDNFATLEPASPAVTIGTAGWDRRKGGFGYYNGSGWSDRGLNNGEDADVPWNVVGNDSLTGWNVATHNRGQLTISSLEPDSVWIPRPTNYLSQTPGEKVVVDVWNNQTGDTLTVFFDSIFRKFNQKLLLRGQVPPKSRLQYTFKVNPSVEGVAWICTDDIDGHNLVGIDTTIISGDSAYLKDSNGELHFTGMTDFPKNRGRIIYVSKSGWRGTGSEEIGNPQKPYHDPWAAKAAMLSGDLMYVFKDNYTFGLTGGGYDKEGSSTNTFRIWDGTLDTTYFFLEPGTKLIGTGSDANLFGVTGLTTSKFIRIEASGASVICTTPNNLMQFFICNSTSATGYIDAIVSIGSLYDMSWNGCKTNGRYVFNVGKIYNRQTSIGRTAFTFGMDVNGTSSTAMRRSLYDLNVREFELIDAITPSPSSFNTALFQVYTVDSALINMNFDNVKFLARSAPFRISSANNLVTKNSQINVTVKNAFFDDSYLNSISSSKSYTISSSLIAMNYSANIHSTDTNAINILLHTNASSASVNNIVNFNIGTIQSAFAIGGTGFDSTSVLRYNIDNWVQLRSCPLYLNAASGGGSSTGNINFEVKNAKGRTQLIVDTANSSNFTASGRYYITTVNKPVFDNYSATTTRKRTFYNCRFINFGTPALASSAAISVETMGCYAKYPTDDADVTELIESIVKNTNVR